MHRINFCKSLCLPKSFEGYDCFGMDIIREFPEAVLIPMAGIATPAHVLYVSKPVMYRGEEATILKTKDLDSKEKLDALCKDSEATILAPDHALDIDSRADVVFANRENSLKFMVDKLLCAGYKRVAIWANNGIGRDAQNAKDGVMHTDDGVAVGTRLNGNAQPFYQKGMPESYQNTAHQHIHIAPIMNDMFPFDQTLRGILEELHNWQERQPLEEQRKRIQENISAQDLLPCISLCIVDPKYDHPDDSLIFTHYYASANLLFPQFVMSGLVRTIVLNCTKQHEGFDMNDPATKEEHIRKTKRFYQELLISNS